MRRLSGLYDLLDSPELFVGTVVTLLFWGCFSTLVLDGQFWTVFQLVPSKIVFVLLVANRLLAMRKDLQDRRTTFLLNLGILIVLSGAIWNYAGRYEGIVGLGEGESFETYDHLQKGLLARPSAFPYQVEQIAGDFHDLDKSGKIELSETPKSPVYLQAGQSLRSSSGARITAMRIMSAPRVVIADQKGKELLSSFLKLNLFPLGTIDHIKIEDIPYRFYFNLTGKKETPLGLMVVRGKLILARKDLALGETLSYGGMTISVPEVGRWAEFKVDYVPGKPLLFAGAAIMAAGIVFHLLRRRTKLP